MKFRIKELRKSSSKKIGKPITQGHLAKAANVTIGTINKIENGGIENPRFAILESIATYFTQILQKPVSVSDLLESSYERPLWEYLTREKSTTSPFDAKGPDFKGPFTDLTLGGFPLQDTYSAVPEFTRIPDGDFLNSGQGDMDTLHWMPNSWVGEGKFFFRMKTEAMSPTIEKGDLMLINPRSSVSNGKIVLANLSDRVVCRRLFLADKKYVLIPDNKNHQVSLVEDTDRLIGQVIQSTRRHDIA